MNNIFIKILLAPFSLLYGLIIGVRNLCYDAGLLRSAEFSLPVINIGNLTIGGAGKTPHVEYLIRLLKEYTNVAVLSRGYKRKTKGFLFVENTSNVLNVGDEPLQYKRKYKNIVVAVSESRALGIPEILKKYPTTDLVVLDDAFQHRAVNPSLNILLTEYERPYHLDMLLPSGRLRESSNAAYRADVVIVTKCPKDSQTISEEVWRLNLDLKERQQLFFSKYKYNEAYNFFTGQRLKLTIEYDIVLISAIASTSYLKDHLSDNVNSINHLEYEDHHIFSEVDIDYIVRVFQEDTHKRKLIVTTEKDAMRLSVYYEKLRALNLPIYVLPIEVEFLFDGKTKFDEYIRDFLLNFRV